MYGMRRRLQGALGGPSDEENKGFVFYAIAAQSAPAGKGACNYFHSQVSTTRRPIDAAP